MKKYILYIYTLIYCVLGILTAYFVYGAIDNDRSNETLFTNLGAMLLFIYLALSLILHLKYSRYILLAFGYLIGVFGLIGFADYLYQGALEGTVVEFNGKDISFVGYPTFALFGFIKIYLLHNKEIIKLF